METNIYECHNCGADVEKAKINSGLKLDQKEQSWITDKLENFWAQRSRTKRDQVIAHGFCPKCNKAVVLTDGF